MLADTVEANLQERSHLGEIINVQLDVHVGRSKKHTPLLVGLGKEIACNARMANGKW